MVTITTGSALGSGVIVDANGVIVTNLHVVRGATQVSVRLANGDTYDDVAVVDVDERKDLLLLKIKAFGLQSVTIADSEQVKVGDKVILIGSPRGLNATVSDGLISAIRDSGDGYRVFQTNAAASPGSSGGGMFNDFGELTGIVGFKRSDGENLNFAIPSNYVRGLLATQPRMTLAQLKQQYPEKSATGESASANAGRLGRLLESSGFRTLKKENDETWSISYQGDKSDGIVVLISSANDLAIIQSIVATGPRLSPDRMSELLKLNFSRDLVKVSLSTRGDLIVLNETESRLLDADALKSIVDAVATLADDVVGLLEGAATAITPALLGPPRGGRLRTLSMLRESAAIRYDQSEWRTQNTGEAEVYQVEHSSEAAYVRVIAERLQVNADKLLDMAFANMRTADSNARELRRGTRLVNGLTMTFLEVQAMVDNVPVTYFGHYFSDGTIAVQLIGWSHRDLIDNYRDEIESFVSGFQLAQR